MSNTGEENSGTEAGFSAEDDVFGLNPGEGVYAGGGVRGVGTVE